MANEIDERFGVTHSHDWDGHRILHSHDGGERPHDHDVFMQPVFKDS